MVLQLEVVAVAQELLFQSKVELLGGQHGPIWHFCVFSHVFQCFGEIWWENDVDLVKTLRILAPIWVVKVKARFLHRFTRLAAWGPEIKIGIGAAESPAYTLGHYV